MKGLVENYPADYAAWYRSVRTLLADSGQNIIRLLPI